MSVEERVEALRSTAEELVGEDELLPLLHGNPSPVWRALGMSSDGVEFLSCSEETSRRAHEYWPLVMGISRNHYFGCLHANPDNVKRDQLLEPIMKCADILFLEAAFASSSTAHRFPARLEVPSAPLGRAAAAYRSSAAASSSVLPDKPTFKRHCITPPPVGLLSPTSRVSQCKRHVSLSFLDPTLLSLI
ncbi:hypothetical protein ZWY2020_025461 [Hordeum vulgare]|nr:hypothetical protein ZWY2020_025461 [Hordeum vulgare]